MTRRYVPLKPARRPRRCIFCNRRLDRRRRQDVRHGFHRRCFEIDQQLAKIAGQSTDAAWPASTGDIAANLREIVESFERDAGFFPRHLLRRSGVTP